MAAGGNKPDSETSLIAEAGDVLGAITPEGTHTSGVDHGVESSIGTATTVDGVNIPASDVTKDECTQGAGDEKARLSDVACGGNTTASSPTLSASQPMQEQPATFHAEEQGHGAGFEREPSLLRRVFLPPRMIGGESSTSNEASGKPASSAHRPFSGGSPPRRGRSLNPLFSLTIVDLLRFASGDAARNKVSLFSNVAAILFGTVLTAVLVALLIGVNGYLAVLLPRIPGIDTLVVTVDPSTGASPITEDEVYKLGLLPGAIAAIPDIKQLAFAYQRKEREAFISLASSVASDPATGKLRVLAGQSSVNPEKWEMVIPQSAAEEIDNFNPMGLVGKTVTVILRRYKDVNSSEVSKEISFPVTIVGLVKETPKSICYASLNMVRVLRDFGTGRGEYQPAPGEPVDVSKISPRTRFEGVRVHFQRPALAEHAYALMRRDKSSRFQLYWPGSEVAYLRDVQLISAIVLIGIGILATVAGSISIFNTLAASVARKSKDFGILRATGFGASDIFMIVLWQAVLMGGLAGVSGLGVAWLVIAMLNDWIAGKWPELIESLQNTGLSGLFVLPPHVALLIFLAVVLICVGSGLLPSWQASKRTPMDALRDAT